MQHMCDTADIVNRHAGSIYTMQGLFTGNCGEMTGSRYMSSDDIQALARCLASSTLSSIKLAVRTPAQWRTIPQDCSYRFGLFNDGMTGSVYDLGTYSDRTVTSDYTSRWARADELAFQNNLCRYAPNGGEAVIDNIYNDYPSVITDLSTMGISYLNSMHDAAVLNNGSPSHTTPVTLAKPALIKIPSTTACLCMIISPCILATATLLPAAGLKL